jgi:uncharacterized protein (DUF1330 family)
MSSLDTPTLNATDPTPEQIKSFLGESPKGEPVFMLNLLKFKERATYNDGEDVSGAEAYGRYAKAFGEMLKELNIEGAETVFGGNMNHVLIGQGDWDAAAIVRYPDAQTMFETVSSDRYRKIHYHRKAGLAGQLLISCDARGVF